MRQTGIGLEIREQELIAAIVTDDGGTLELTGLQRIHGKLTDPKTQAALARLTRQIGGQELVVALPCQQATLRKFGVAFHDPAQISQIIDTATEQHLPAQNIDDLVIDFHILRRDHGHAKLLTAALPKVVLRQALTALEAGNLYPQGIELDLLGLYHTWQRTSAPILQDHAAGHCLVLEVRPEVCYLLFTQAGQLLEARAIPLAFRSVAAGMRADLQDTVELDLTAPDPVAPAPVSLTPQQQQQLSRRLTKELPRTLMNAPGLDSIYLCGEPQLVAILPDLLQTALQLPVTPWDFSQAFRLAPGLPADLIPHATVAVGLALKALGRTTGGFNFRKHEFAYTHAWTRLRRPLAITLTLLALLLIPLANYSRQALTPPTATYDQAVAVAREVYRRSHPTDTLPTLRGTEVIGYIKTALDEAIQSSQPTIPELPDTLMCWAALFEILTPVRRHYAFTIDHLILNTQDLLIEGRTESDLLLDALKLQLKKLAWLDLNAQSLQVHTQLLAEPKNPKLPRMYRIQVKVREGGATR